MSGIANEFKQFAVKGNVVDMAVGVVVGAAFTTIVNSMVADLITPPLGLLVGNVDFSNLFVVLKEGSRPAPYVSLAEAKTLGAVTLNIGLFLNTLFNFLLIAFPVFMLIRAINKLRKEAEVPAATAAPAPETKDCPRCLSKIPLRATRCPHCTSEL